jgi:hypothetical protein
MLAQDDLSQGIDQLCNALELLPTDLHVGTCGTVVQECVRQMKEFGSQRVEYILLALHTFDCAFSG